MESTKANIVTSTSQILNCSNLVFLGENHELLQVDGSIFIFKLILLIRAANILGIRPNILAFERFKISETNEVAEN